MNHYLEARQWLRSEVSFEEFEERLPQGLREQGLLSLLVGAVMEQGLEPFEKYFELFLRQMLGERRQARSRHQLLPVPKQDSPQWSENESPHVRMQKNQNPHHLQVYHRDQNGRNAVHYAVENLDPDQAQTIVKILIEQHPLLKDMGNYSKGNYITLAIREVKSALLETLIEEDVNPHFRSLEGLGPLHQAVRAHKHHKNRATTLEIIKILLNAGCPEQDKNKEGQTYMNYARDKGYLHQEDIDQILQEIMSSTTPKQTIETSPEQKINERLSIESGQVQADHSLESSSESEEEEVEGEPDHQKISAEMYGWAFSTQQQHNRTWALIYPCFLEIQEIVAQYYGTIEVIGSFASHLWIPSSDVDFLMIVPDGGSLDLFEDITEGLYRRIAKLGFYSSIKLIRTYKLPLIKLVLSPQYQKMQLQLFLSNKKNIASRYVAFTNDVMSYYPQIAVIYYVLRKLLSIKKLHDHRNGGLKAYALFLLIYSIRVNYQYSYASQFIEHFCFYYGSVFQYQVQMGSSGDPEYHMNIVDPLNSDNNMGGKKTNILLLQQLLQKVYLGLNTSSVGSKMAYLTDLLKLV